MSEPITTQPTSRADPTLTAAEQEQENFASGAADGKAKFISFAELKTKLTTKEGWIGDFPFAVLCMPQLPCSFGRGKKVVKAAPFYALDEPMPILLALLCGFQHCLAMLAGLITPPIIFSSQLGFTGATQNQMVAVSLIASGFLSAVQMTRFKIPFTKYYSGTGLITVVGTSFATLSTGSAIFNTLYADGTCPSTVLNGVTTRGPCPAAYGYLVGTSALCSLLEMGLAFAPPKVLKKIFPPIVTGTVVLLIGASLIGESGMLNWAGGSGACHLRPATGLFRLCPNINAPKPLPWGDAKFLGLGLLSFSTIILLEFVGSPAMKSASIIIGLLVGCIVAGPAGYMSAATINAAPPITFLWVQTFPLKVHPPAILPMMAVYIALAMEATGDITASSEVSRQPVSGPLFDSRVQGGILADGINGLLSALFMNPPLSIFAQNNGVISITRCANRFAGYCCCGFLLFFGIIAKISGIFLAIPASVLGGVTTFLFATVMSSGLKVISSCGFTRRDRIILAAALSLGVGNLLVEDWFEHIFTYTGDNRALLGFFNSITIVVSTPFLIGGLVASLLNGLLPADPDAVPEYKPANDSSSEDMEASREAKRDEKA